MPFYCEYVCFSCRQPWDIQTGWRRRWRTGTGWPASRLCVTLIRRPGNPSTSHLSKYLPLTLCCSYFTLLCGNIAAGALNAWPFSDALAGRLQSNAFHDNHGFLCSASYESVRYQFSACTFFPFCFLATIITRQANTGVRWNGFFLLGLDILPVSHLLTYLIIVLHMLPWKRSIHALSLCFHLRPAIPGTPCLVFFCLHCVFKIAFCFFCLSEHHVVCCMHSNLNFLWNLLTPYSW